MPTVKFTANLKRFYPGLDVIKTDKTHLPNILSELESKFPGLSDYIVDEHGRLRKHVNIFIGNNLIRDREGLSDSVNSEDEIYVMQALSGG